MDLRELYQSTILDHNKKPRNFRVPEGRNREAQGYNPLCGDMLTVYLELDGDRVADVGFQGTGCAISRASASLMTEAVKGRPLKEMEALFDRFHALVTGDPLAEPATDGLGKLTVFAGASLALVVAAGIGVLAGGFISQYISEKSLHYVAGIGFIAIGIWTVLKA